jgi:hypothetical protein
MPVRGEAGLAKPGVAAPVLAYLASLLRCLEAGGPRATLGAYAAICKETGRPFVFPGSPQQYEAVVDITDGRIIAKHLLWAATKPVARNNAFNIVQWGSVPLELDVAEAGRPSRCRCR